MSSGPNGRPALTVYTVLVGTKEALGNPLAELPPGASSDLALDFVCFTDNPALRSDVWRCVPLPEQHLPPEKLSRRPKALPHLYLPDATHSLYIDNTITLRRLPQAADLQTTRPYLLRAFTHPERQTLQQEADAVAVRGYDDIGTICNQLEFYASRAPLATLPPLMAGGVLLREHHHPVVARFGTLWWENFLAFTKRDQLAMGFSLRQAGAEIEPLPGALDDNDLVAWIDHPGKPRVRANFDAARWAWMHRGDPAAQRDPRAHYLAQWGQQPAPKRQISVLEYICAQQHSSLGSRVAPRRSVAAALETQLAPWRRDPCQFLLVQVRSDRSPLAFDDDELAAARLSLAMLMGRQAQGTLLDVPADTIGTFRCQVPDEPYDMALVLGVPGHRHGALLRSLQPMLNPRNGGWIAVLTSPLPLAEALRAEQAIAGHAPGAAVVSALHGARHDAIPQPMHNGVLGLHWTSPDPASAPASAAPATAVASA